MRKWVNRRVVISWLVALCVIAIDQTTKFFAIAELPALTRVPALGDVLGWYLTFNDSAAFSIGFGITWIFTIISSVAVLTLLWSIPKAKTLGWAILGGCLLGGVSGNLIDRIIRKPGFPNGQVVDFIQIPFNFPIFNIADSFITITMLVVALRVLRGENIGGSKQAKTNV